ncbi:MAG: hypothetical protein Q8S54_19830 [Bacteroidota bacterium]|nr:hypothetical protein [Bacteroidota bacterium]
MSIWRRKYDRVQIGRKQYRIEFNWNALCSCMESEGMRFGQLEKFEKMTPGIFISLLYAGILEGCSIENKTFPYSKEDFAAILTPEAVAQLSIIFQSQNAHSMKDLKKVAG